MKAQDQQEDHIRHLRTLEKALEKMEKQKAQQQQAQVSEWIHDVMKRFMASSLNLIEYYSKLKRYQALCRKSHCCFLYSIHIACGLCLYSTRTYIKQL